MRRLWIAAAATVLTLAVSLTVTAGSALAVVVDLGAGGQSGVALVPGTGLPNSVKVGTPNPSCSDPWLASEFVAPSAGLCWDGGSVMHANQTFALTWDPLHQYWATTQGYVERFLSDVADASGTFTSPYAVTTQYRDGGASADRAGNHSLYGGGCADLGTPGGVTCKFTDATATGSGHNYPANACAVTSAGYALDPGTDNAHCLTDAQIQAHLSTTVSELGLANQLHPGFTPLLVMLTPPGVEVCLDSSGTVCSANADPKLSSPPPAEFCSYHSQIEVDNQKFAYVVQPWTAGTRCDDPNLAQLPQSGTPEQVATDAGSRLVSPLSQGQIAAIVNPWLNGWFGRNGTEINDGTNELQTPCGPVKPGDLATVGTSSYYLQGEFSNAGVIATDPNAPWCAMGVSLAPTFAVPSPVDQGNAVMFDGSMTASSLIVPSGNYTWDFGDGQASIGRSVVHTYAAAGTYQVRLTVIDRGGNAGSVSKTIDVLGPASKPVTPVTPVKPVTPAKPVTPVTPPRPALNPGLQARLQLLPQGLRTLLRAGLAVRVTSNQRADGIATLSISRGDARRAHLASGDGPTVVIARGTVSKVRNGTVSLSLHLSPAVAAKLGRLHHVTLTIRLALVDAGRDHLTIVAAGRY